MRRTLTVGIRSLLASSLLLLALAAPASAAAPTVSEQLPITVDRTVATLHAEVNPNGLATTYHFEYGLDTGYEGRVPASGEFSAGSGSEPVVVSAEIAGLEEESVYFFRVVATNDDGPTVGADRQFSTLNVDGLAWGRRYELVSPSDKGATGQAGQGVVFGGGELANQVSPEGRSIAYFIGYGAPNDTIGGEVAYRSDLGSGGWASTQVAASLAGAQPPIQVGGRNSYGYFNRWLAGDLECAFSISSLLLTDDPAARDIVEAGGFNLYRRNADGTYDLVSNLPRPVVGTGGTDANTAYRNLDASEDCERVIFETQFAYPGVPSTQGAEGGLGANRWNLFEWRDGVLSNPAALPGPSGAEFPTQARPGASALNVVARRNALSDDGSRFFFTSTGAGTSAPLGRDAIFLREDGEPTREVSLSQTATPNGGNARYQMATSDGSQVFFIARYGLAPNATSSGAASCTLTHGDNLGVGCDLYRYSAETGALIDVSASSNPADTAGASVAGVLDASADGSRVFFAAKGQLIVGQGQTYAENTSAGTRGYNVYLWDEGTMSYVATVSQADLTGGNAAGLLVASLDTQEAPKWMSRTTPTGSHLVFQSAAGLTGAASGVIEAYRFSSDSGKLECVSCRRDGEPSNTVPGAWVLSAPADNYAHPARTISEDGTTILFQKWDALATGAHEGVKNIYEWREGQISLLVANDPAYDAVSNQVAFRGASTDASNVFVQTKRRLSPWDTDGLNDIYAARVGGGFDPPPPPPSPCDALSEASCLGPAAPGDPVGSPNSASFLGTGNVKQPCNRKQVRRKGQCVSKLAIARKACVKRQGKAKKRCVRKHVQRLNRATNNNRGAAK